MASVGANRYWTRIKRIVGLSLVGTVLLFVLVGVLADNQPVVNVLIAVWLTAVFVGFLLLVHAISKDKAALSEEIPSVTERHWITIGVLSYFTSGLYLLLYFAVRYYKVNKASGDQPTTPNPPGPDSSATDAAVTVEAEPAAASSAPADSDTTATVDAATRRRSGEDTGSGDSTVSDTSEVSNDPDSTTDTDPASPTPDSGAAGTELCVSLYPEPTTADDRWFAVLDQTIAEHDEDVRDRSFLGTDTVERVFRCAPTQTVLAREEHLQVGGEVISYSDILNCRLRIGRSLLADNRHKIHLNDCDYIALTVANGEIPDGESPAEYDGAVFQLYLIGSIAELEYQTTRSESIEKDYTITDTPSVSESNLKRLYKTISDRLSDSLPDTHILQEYIEVPASLRIAEWNDASGVQLVDDTEVGVNSSGATGRSALGPYGTHTPDSAGTVVAELHDDIDPSSVVSEIRFLQVSDDGLFIDSNPTLQFDYSAIDRIRETDKGFTIEADGIEYEILGPQLFAGSGGFLRLDWTADPTRRDRQTRTLEEALTVITQRVGDSTHHEDTSSVQDRNG